MSKENRLYRRGQKKVSPWFPAGISPTFAGWYDVLFERDNRVRLYWNEKDWLTSPSDEAFPFMSELRRKRFTWRGIDREYYKGELG